MFNLDNDKLNELMEIAITETKLAIKEGNSPFSALLVDKEGNIIVKTHNTAKTDKNPTHHAEINLINKACEILKTNDLSSYILISNAWSCSMCISASIKAKIKNYVFGAPGEDDMNPNITIFDILAKTKDELNIKTGILEEECLKQIKEARKNF